MTTETIMDITRTGRGAWRRGPLPGALSRARAATLTAEAPWAQGPEPRRAPDQLSSSALESPEEARHGGCLCGAVRFEVRGAPHMVGLCHCADCRKATGGTALHFAAWPRSAFAHSGRLSTHAGRSFCPECGGRVVHLTEQVAEVNLGSLDEPPNDLVPSRELWTIRREPWMPPVPGAEQFERDPA